MHIISEWMPRIFYISSILQFFQFWKFDNTDTVMLLLACLFNLELTCFFKIFRGKRSIWLFLKWQKESISFRTSHLFPCSGNGISFFPKELRSLYGTLSVMVIFFFFFSIPGIKGPRNSGLTDWLECYLPWPLSPFLVDHLEHSSLKISENISRSEGEQSPALGFPQAYLTPVITAHTEESSCPTRTWDTWRHMDHVSCGGRATTRTTVFKTVHPVDRMHLGNELPHPPPHLEKPWRFRFLEDCENKRDTRASS